MERSNWLRAPLRLMAASSAASAVGSAALAFAYPHDAALIFGPQAVGTAVEVVAFLYVAQVLSDVLPTQLGWLRKPARLLGLGYSLYAFGWFSYAVAARDERTVLLAAYAVAATGAILTAVAFWRVVRRLPATAVQVAA